MSDEKQTTVNLERGQIWIPANGEKDRQIDDIIVAGIKDHGYKMGELIIAWSTHATKWGECSERSFKAWVRRMKAELLK